MDPGTPDALLQRHGGGRVGMPGLLGDLDRRMRRTYCPFPRLLGLAVDRALTWERKDRRDLQWYPQGISSSVRTDVETPNCGGAALVSPVTPFNAVTVSADGAFAYASQSDATAAYPILEVPLTGAGPRVIATMPTSPTARPSQDVASTADEAVMLLLGRLGRRMRFE